MADVKFLCVIPTNPVESDDESDEESGRISKLAIRGSLRQQPNQYSINFVNSPSCTDNITYHFKVRLPTQTIVENYKSNGEWSSTHTEKALNVFNDSAFSLEFQFDYPNSTIHVYQEREKGYNFVTSYMTLFNLSAIQSIQVWGDVKKIQEFSLSYN